MDIKSTFRLKVEILTVFQNKYLKSLTTAILFTKKVVWPKKARPLPKRQAFELLFVIKISIRSTSHAPHHSLLNHCTYNKNTHTTLMPVE